MTQPRALAVLFLAFGTVALSAQAHRVVPAGTTFDEGNGRSFFPGVLQGGRTQQITDATEIARSNALLREIALRAEGKSNTAGYPARKFARWIVTVGQTKVSPAAMTTTFAANRGATMTKVFDAAFTLPKQPPLKAPPAPFNIVIKFNAPQVFAVAKGNLVWEIEIPGKTTRRTAYFIDGQVGLSAGSTRRFGTGGPFSTSDAYGVASDASKLLPGGSADLTATGLKSAYPALAAYGFSNTLFGPLPLPFDMTALGAPGNHLYASLDLLLPMTLSQQGTTFGGSIALPIPSANLTGLQLYGQVLFFSKPSNSFGIVFSNAVEMVIGSTNRTPSVAIGAYDSTLATGSFAVPGTSITAPHGGIVEQFGGTFN